MTTPLTYEVSPHPAPASAERRAQVLANPGFGKAFTDHMVLATWTVADGWRDGKVVPYGPLSLDPATAVLHYAQEVFEGMKAYRHADRSIWTFRPEVNAERMRRSCRRLALPELDTESFVESLRALVRADEPWVPEHAPGNEASLYLRPFMFASEAFLGVRAAAHVTYCVIASPAGAYFAGGLKPVSIWVTDDYTRAAPGGTGAAKCGGNYAASLAAQVEAAGHGCDQVAYLDATERRWVEELGGMNLYFVFRDGQVATPELGTILEGVTRDSIMKLCADFGFQVSERKISIEEWREGAASGQIAEVFACGTAAVVTPVGRLVWDGGEVLIGDHSRDGGIGAATRKIRQSLLDIQYGRAEDRYGWLTRLV
jgi:branched-chain amino acid aminotransferase